MKTLQEYEKEHKELGSEYQANEQRMKNMQIRLVELGGIIKELKKDEIKNDSTT